jgi:hypothetical protein
MHVHITEPDSESLPREYPIHPVAAMFPLMDESELAGLAADIKENGLREPLWTHEGKVIDGRNRLKACQIAGVVPEFREWEGKGRSLTKFVISLNYYRRHLTVGQKAIIGIDVKKRLETEYASQKAAKCSDAGKKGGRGNKKGGQTSLSTLSRPRRASEDAAKSLGISHASISAAEKIAEASPETAKEVSEGKKTIAQAKKELGLTPRAPKGQCRVNGELVDDTPEIAKMRAKGTIPVGVIPTVTLTDNPTSVADIAEEIEERKSIEWTQLSDEDWLNKLPARSKLTGDQRESFDFNALSYRRAEPFRKEFRRGWDQFASGAPEKRKGPYIWKVASFLKVEHPEYWTACPATTVGGCNGAGKLKLIGKCPMCKGKGFRLK